MKKVLSTTVNGDPHQLLADTRQTLLGVLRDTLNLEIPSHVRHEARQLAEEGVSEIKKEVFPRHRISA